VLLLITDHLGTYKKNKDFIYCRDLYSWKTFFKNNKFSTNPTPLHKWMQEDQQISAIVSPSNYKLIYDLYTYDKNTIIYKPGSLFKDGVKAKELINSNEMMKFFQRSYISYSMYTDFASLGFRRIEPLIVSLAIYSNNKKTKEQSTYFQLVEKFIQEGLSLEDAASKPITLFNSLTINDPFLINTEKVSSNVLENGPISLWNSLSGILNSRDAALNFASLVKQKKILLENNSLILNPKLHKKINPKANIYFIEKQNWQTIYDSQSFLFGTSLPSLSFRRKAYTCPICGGKQYNLTPNKIFCRDKYCNFVFLKKNLSKIGIVFNESDLIMAINTNSITKKTKDGQVLTLFLQNKKNLYYLAPKTT